ALVRQLALLANGHEARGHLVRDGTAENEAACLDAGDLVDLRARPRLHQLVDGSAKGARIAKQRGDVAEDDPRLGVIGNGAYRFLEVMLERNADHGLSREWPLGLSLWRTAPAGA